MRDAHRGHMCVCVKWLWPLKEQLPHHSGKVAKFSGGYSLSQETGSGGGIRPHLPADELSLLQVTVLVTTGASSFSLTGLVTSKRVSIILALV